MKQLLKLLFLLLLFAAPAFSQGYRYDNFVLKPLPAGGVTPVSGALITVCTSAGTGMPCTPKVANIYSDEALSAAITGTGGAGTTNSDANGNFGFYLSPGSYIVTVTGSGFTSYTIKLVAPVGLATNNTFSGTATFTGTILCKNFEQTLCIDSVNTGAWAGTDVLGWANAAYAALPISGSGSTVSGGGTIHISPKPDGSCYSASTPFVANTVGKPVLLDLDTATCIIWTPSSGTMLTFDWGGNHKTKAGISGGELRGPGSGSTAVGIAVGVTNGAEGVVIYGVHIGTQLANGFLTNISYANNVSFASTIEKSHILAGGTGVNYASPGAESNRINDSIIAQNTVGFNVASAGSDLKVRGTSIDDNATGFTVTGGTLVCDDCHFENVNGGAATYGTVSNGSLALLGGTIVDDVGSGTQAQFFSLTGLSYFHSLGTSINSLGRTVTQAVNFAGTSRGILGFIVGSANITNTFNTAYAGGPVFDFSTLGVGTPAITAKNFNFAAGNILTNNIIQGTGTGTQAALFQPGAGTNAYPLVLNNPGSNRTWTFSDTTLQLWGGLLPGSAGGFDVGSTALPFGNLWLGTAATNNLKFQPAAMAAARILTIPDPLGAVNMPYVIASGTSTLTSNATLAAVTSQAAITTTATNALTTDAIEWSYATAPTAGDSLCHVSPYVTAGNVNFVRTNPTASAQNVSALVINWRVIR